MLILNRIKVDMVKRGDMMAMDDVTEILAIEILGIVPDDESIVICANKGEPSVTDPYSRAGIAYKNISKRILGNTVPLMDLDVDKGILKKIKKLFKAGN